MNLQAEYEKYKNEAASFDGLAKEIIEYVEFLENMIKDNQKWYDAAQYPPKTRDDVIICNITNRCVSVGWYNEDHNNGEGKWLIRSVHFDGEVEIWKPLPYSPDHI